MSNLTIQEEVLYLLSLSLAPHTATEIAHALDKKLSSVSSVLTKMVKNNLITRISEHGPRGGYGYAIPRFPHE